MSTTPPSNDDLLQQAKHHLASLEAAGVEWLPTHPPVPVTATPEPATSGSSPAPPEPALVTSAGSLFEEDPTPPPVSAGLTVEQRRRSLELLAEQVSTCSRCSELYSTRTQTVFGEGPLDVELCFVGEAPGGEEDAQGRPFVGPAGQLLNRIIAACGLKREEVYVCNILRCRPPGNRTPLPQEADHCREYLEKTLELVRPKFICALGGCAAQNLLQTTASLGKLRGRFHNYRGIPVLCTYHPAYLLPHRNPDKKPEVWKDMKLLIARMGRQIPQPPPKDQS